MLATIRCDHLPCHQPYVEDETHGSVNFLLRHSNVKVAAKCQNTFDGPMNNTAI